MDARILDWTAVRGTKTWCPHSITSRRQTQFCSHMVISCLFNKDHCNIFKSYCLNPDIHAKRDLETLHNYFENWSLRLNPAKSVHCCFHLNNHRAERKLNLFINNSQITHSEHPKYLGIHLDRTLTFKTHLTKLKGKLSSRNNILHKLAGSSWGSDANTLRTSALALIFSTAEYCAPVWEGSCHTKLIDTQLNSTLRIITGVCQPTRIDWLPVLAHISPPELRRKEATKKMYQKLLDSPDLEINPILQSPPKHRLKSRKPIWCPEETNFSPKILISQKHGQIPGSAPISQTRTSSQAQVSRSQNGGCAGPTDGRKSQEDEDVLCGVGSCRPAFLQRFASPRAFLANYCALGILQGAYFTYTVGVMSTLERRYAFESKISGVILIADNLSPIVLSLVIGFYGGSSHRPRLIFGGMLVVVLSCFLSSLPFVIFGSRDVLQANVTNALPSREFCTAPGREASLCESSSGLHSSPTFAAVVLLFLANFLNGFGYTAFYTIGTPYLDDNVKKKDSPLYLSIPFGLLDSKMAYFGLNKRFICQYFGWLYANLYRGITFLYTIWIID
ncbi:hypothetical protein LAZ67_1005181 [Cordylochernes scorpioides]|uniref:Uncharacterized protein n=1 Tax=Cordylochernes scorpioides TaxID=51811 RepID=A0ABY6JZS8_9ARAC|nr:hypothetical protein LAZ67_1005181 [Cordylochernes scorpioides]